MKPELTVFALTCVATVCAAQNTQTAPPATANPTDAQRATRPRQAPPPPEPVSGNPTASADKDSSAGGAPKLVSEAQFISEAKWELAGYNNNEVVYTVFVTNQDTRIIRCTTEVKGFYFENGARLSISDRQITTIFPNQPTRVGYWMDMDQQSGATYSVKCRPV